MEGVYSIFVLSVQVITRDKKLLSIIMKNLEKSLVAQLLALCGLPAILLIKRNIKKKRKKLALIRGPFVHAKTKTNYGFVEHRQEVHIYFLFKTAEQYIRVRKLVRTFSQFYRLWFFLAFKAHLHITMGVQPLVKQTDENLKI